jgi:hypothetical protein
MRLSVTVTVNLPVYSFTSDAILCGVCALDLASEVSQDYQIPADEIMLSLRQTFARYCQECGACLHVRTEG